MKEDLLNYMNKRSHKLSREIKTGGPVVTISREKGCPGSSIAEKLADKLVELTEDKDWRWINKDIIEKSAKELHMNPTRIKHVLHSEDKGFFRDLMLSFGERYYESDIHVKRTLAELIKEFSFNGKVILVGLGGVSITNNISKSVHFKLYAPYKWRLKQVMLKENMDSEKAREYIDETDINRQLLIDYYNGLKAGNDLFHIQFNASILSEDEIVDEMIELMVRRNLIFN